jgi:hypothetical protein
MRSLRYLLESRATVSGSWDGGQRRGGLLVDTTLVVVELKTTSQ